MIMIVDLPTLESDPCFKEDSLCRHNRLKRNPKHLTSRNVTMPVISCHLTITDIWPLTVMGRPHDLAILSNLTASDCALNYCMDGTSCMSCAADVTNCCNNCINIHHSIFKPQAFIFRIDRNECVFFSPTCRSGARWFLVSIRT
jgi:hypothetical protein